ncbi:unknown [Prevotella sp. CAG:1031]|nr:unknown [Prevotella sp. CAG:1031]
MICKLSHYIYLFRVRISDCYFVQEYYGPIKNACKVLSMI